MIRFYEGIIHAGEWFSSYLLLAMRLYWGYAFFQSGMGKFAHIEETVQFFESLNIPFALANVYAVASIEAAGGLLLLIGLGSRLVAIPLIAVMCGAYLTAHFDALVQVFSKPEVFISRAPFNFLLMCLVIFSFGPGIFSMDYLLQRKK